MCASCLCLGAGGDISDLDSGKRGGDISDLDSGKRLETEIRTQTLK
jgi:hypothetical protein